MSYRSGASSGGGLNRKGGASNNGGGKGRYSADVTKGPSAWKQEWSGFISGVKMTEQGRKVKLSRHLDHEKSGGGGGGDDGEGDEPVNTFSYLFSSPADRKAEREARKKEEERKRRERMLANQRAGLAEYKGDDRSLMERAVETAKVQGLQLEGLNRKQKRELLHLTKKDGDDEADGDNAEEDPDREIKPHELMDPKVAWYQQGPYPIDEISEKLVIKKAAKKAKQMGLKYNSLTVHPSWVAARAMKRKLLVHSTPCGFRKTFDDEGNVAYDSNSFLSWAVPASASITSGGGIVPMGGTNSGAAAASSDMIGFDGISAPSAAAPTAGQILLEKFQKQQLRKREERLAQLAAADKEAAASNDDDEDTTSKHHIEGDNKKDSEDTAGVEKKLNAKQRRQQEIKEQIEQRKAKQELAKKKREEEKAERLAAKGAVASSKPVAIELPKVSADKKNKDDATHKKKITIVTDNEEPSKVTKEPVRNDNDDDDNVNDGDDADYFIDNLNGGESSDSDDDGGSDDDSVSDFSDTSSDSDEDDTEASGKKGEKRPPLSDEDRKKKNEARRAARKAKRDLAKQRRKEKKSKQPVDPNKKTKRDPKPDSIRTLKQQIFEKYGGKRPPRDIRDQLKKAKAEADARKKAAKARRNSQKMKVGPKGDSKSSSVHKPAGIVIPSTPADAAGSVSQRQLKKQQRLEAFVAKKKALEAAGATA